MEAGVTLQPFQRDNEMRDLFPHFADTALGRTGPRDPPRSTKASVCSRRSRSVKMKVPTCPCLLVAPRHAASIHMKVRTIPFFTSAVLCAATVSTSYAQIPDTVIVGKVDSFVQYTAGAP